MTVLNKILKWAIISVAVLAMVGGALAATRIDAEAGKPVAPEPARPQAAVRTASAPEPPVVPVAAGAPRFTRAAIERTAETEIAKDLTASTRAKGLELEPGTMKARIVLHGEPRGRLRGGATFRVTDPGTGVRTDVDAGIRGSYDLRGRGRFTWATTRITTRPVAGDAAGGS